MASGAHQASVLRFRTDEKGPDFSGPFTFTARAQLLAELAIHRPGARARTHDRHEAAGGGKVLEEEQGLRLVAQDGGGWRKPAHGAGAR